MRSSLSRTVLLLLGFAASAPSTEPDIEGVRFFESKVRPLLIENCYQCHSAGAKKVKGDLLLDTRAGILKGGSGGPLVVGTDPDKSTLLHSVKRKHKEIAAMPPDRELSSAQVADLVAWVARGIPSPEDAAPAKAKESIADAQKRWPFVPVPPVVVLPKVEGDWAGTPIDRFILAKLQAKGLRPVADADRATLIRRVTYDLTGLPPTPEQVEAFVRDTAADAWERVIDRLLASRAYGERWGRHWLDVVRYADTAGDNADFPVPQMHRYRDWVIDAVDADMPFDRFVKEQIAGDLMGGKDDAERYRRVVATGYLANARRFGSRVDDYPWHLTIEDTLDNLGRAMLGMTVNCARCHDHKFDPIGVGDYYGLYGMFASTRYPFPGIELEQRQRDLVPLTPPDKVAGVIAGREKANKDFEARLKTLYGDKGKAADDKAKQEAIQKQIDTIQGEQRRANGKLPYPVAYGMAEGKKVGDVPIQIKGDPEKPGAVAPRRFLEVLGGQKLAGEDKSSGRLKLAEWIASPGNPMFARVFANRLWEKHFGRGIVATPNDFGKQGTPPTHPELLDYLARSLIQNGFSAKKLHREILLSRVYRLASAGEIVGGDTADPNNELLGKFRRRRLDAESIRDTLLVVSGQLDTSPAGEQPFPEMTEWNYTQHNPFRAVYETRRRSVYLMRQRIQRHPYLAIFDGPDPSVSTGNRVTSTTALQALFFINNEFVHDRAKALSARIRQDRTDEPARIDRAYRLLLGRAATPAEVRRGGDYLRQVSRLSDAGDAWDSYVRSLLRLNEFVYLD